MTDGLITIRGSAIINWTTDLTGFHHEAKMVWQPVEEVMVEMLGEDWQDHPGVKRYDKENGYVKINFIPF